MRKNNVSIVRKGIIEGLKISSEKLKASKRQSGKPIVVSENSIVKEIEAKDIK